MLDLQAGYHQIRMVLPARDKEVEALDHYEAYEAFNSEGREFGIEELDISQDSDPHINIDMGSEMGQLGDTKGSGEEVKLKGPTDWHQESNLGKRDNAIGPNMVGPPQQAYDEGLAGHREVANNEEQALVINGAEDVVNVLVGQVQ